MKEKSVKLKNKSEEELAKIKPEGRVLLMPHCLRHSETCTAKTTRSGVKCNDDCKNKCSIGRLRILAERLGYKGVCIAPGGSMALGFVRKALPKAIIAIACDKELEEGIEAIEEISSKLDKDYKPVLVTVPLTKDGCVDTEVDEKEAMRVIKI